MEKILYFLRYCGAELYEANTHIREITIMAECMISKSNVHISNICLIMYAESIYYSIQIAAKLSFSSLCLP